MDVLRLIEARIARWMAYSDYCMNSDFDLLHCRTFWIWAAIAGTVLAAGIAVYVARQFASRSEPAGKSTENSAE